MYSSRYGRWRYISSSLGGMQNENPCEPIFNKKKSPRSAEAQRGEIVHGSLSKTLTEPTTKADAQLRPHRYPNRVALRGRKKGQKKIAPKRRSATRRNFFRREEQIIGTQDEPQMLVAQRLLAILQCLDSTKSSTMDLSAARITL